MSSVVICSKSLRKRHKEGYIPVIPDIKCKSPAEGDLIRGRDPVSLAKGLEAAGAPVISVVTENDRYGGSIQLLSDITKSVNVPVLRKDFITDEEEIRKSIDNGASSVLLISSIMTKNCLFKLIEKSLSLGIEPLVEIHTEDELKAVKNLNLSFLGINNRDITRWEMDNGTVNNTENLAAEIPEGALLVSESSISSIEDIRRAVKAGAHSVLIGTAILKAEDSLGVYRSFANLKST
ncbi:MAG: indole-3-glycerol-phosphate synthase [Halanaerobiales bacterium]